VNLQILATKLVIASTGAMLIVGHEAPFGISTLACRIESRITLAKRETLDKSYKGKCPGKYFPFGSMPVLFCVGIEPNRLNVHSYSASGLPQAKGFGSSPRARRRSLSSSLWFHFAAVAAPIVV
jgi:hypothetical protein